MNSTPLATCAATVTLIAALLLPSPVASASTSPRAPRPTRAPTAVVVDEIGVDLAVSIVVSPWDPEQSSQLVYTVTVANLGKGMGSWASVRSPLAGHLEWVTGDGGCSPAGDAVICSFSPLAGGESRQRRFVLEVYEPYPIETIQEAVLTATVADPAPHNNVAWVRTVLDVEPPVVEWVRAVSGETGRWLRACTQLSASPHRLEVTFSEPMATAPTARFVDVGSSYRLVSPGPDGVFEPRACAEVGGSGLPSDDVEHKILGVHWDEESLSAVLELDPGESSLLGGGPMRMVACRSLTDLAGNPLDGDGDGEGGDDARVDFRVDEGNLIDNGHFDCNTDSWVAVGTYPEAFTLGEDSQGSALSGSARIESDNDGVTIGAGQCVVEPTPGLYSLSLLHRVTPTFGELELSPIAGAWVGAACTLFRSTTCDGMTQLVDQGVSVAVPDPGDGTWSKLIAAFEVSEDIGSLLCTVSASSEGEAPTLEFDRVQLIREKVTGESSPDREATAGR